MTKTPDIRIRRIYDASSPQDGTRILVDRLWPRGVSKQAAEIDEWLKSVAPSTGLRRWYGHEPAKFSEFKRRYADELRDPDHEQAWQHLVDEAGKGSPITLLTASKDLERSEAAALAEWLVSA